MPAPKLVTAWRTHLDGHARLIRLALFLYILLAASPIRFWRLSEGIDPTWRFALNYAAAHGYKIGRDYVYTSGPLIYLIFPENIGDNLTRGLIFQSCLWLALGAIFADLFFRGGFRIRNLALFSFCFFLAVPIFCFDAVGPENLMVAGALLLLAMFHLRGGWLRYASALILIGFVPFLKLSAGMIAAAALTGFLIERMLARRGKALKELAMAAIIPLATAAPAWIFLVPSGSSLPDFLRGSAEVVRGYSAAMSLEGSKWELVAALGAAALLPLLLCFQNSIPARLPRFYLFLLIGPLLISLKHGFVRQDEHVTNFFCFVALGLAIVSLTVSLAGPLTRYIPLLIVIFALIWPESTSRQREIPFLAESSGAVQAWWVMGALSPSHLRETLNARNREFPASSRIEPQLISAIGTSTVASLSGNFTNLAAAGLNLKFYPSIQRLASYTPYLDRWNAQWIRDKGPQYLLFDGETIDGRDAWAETPAMWLEVYRWYDTDIAGQRNLLLKRRSVPRFRTLESLGRSRGDFTTGLQIPSSDSPVFWTMDCALSTSGKLENTLMRIAPVTMRAHEKDGRTRAARRILAGVLVSPVLGNYLPASLAQFAALFGPDSNPGYSVDSIHFGGDGVAAYDSSCNVEFLRPAR